MEAETYLTQGYAIRCAFETKTHGWCRLGSLMGASAPPRIKQVLVAPNHGIPYLNTSQAFDPIPRPRKWLAAGRTGSLERRLVREGTILVMASATVGRTIVATKQHEESIISHHFMRVVPNDDFDAGWIYAFLRSDPGQALMRSSQYASIIRHIEPTHLAGIPIPTIDDELKDRFNGTFERIIQLRNEAAELTERSYRVFEAAVEVAPAVNKQDWAFGVRAKLLAGNRRRLEASYYTPVAQAIVQRFKRSQALSELTHRVWWGKRFKRLPSASGRPYLSADDLFTMNPYEIERIVVADGTGTDQLMVQPGWIVMACSGQTYGLNGSAQILTGYHSDFLLSHDLIRIEPDLSKVRVGYLLTALTHPTLGRPLVTREAYGSSIPHIDPIDLATIPIVRLQAEIENKIADLAEDAAYQFAEAEALERQMVEDATEIVRQFLAFI